MAGVAKRAGWMAGSAALAMLAACAHAPPIANHRPPVPMPPASGLIAQCQVAVRFNEDEASVPESDYLDGMFCLGLMEGILGTNAALPDGHKLFCLPGPGIKTWIAAKAVVDVAHGDPSLLAGLDETEFPILALSRTYPCAD